MRLAAAAVEAAIHAMAGYMTISPRAIRALCPLLLILAGCENRTLASATENAGSNVSLIRSAASQKEGLQATNAVPGQTPIYSYDVVNTWPHDHNAFTQGLIYLNGELLESTGLEGRSSLRKVELKTGAVEKQVNLSSEYFAEGLATLGGKLYQLTWRNHKCFVYDLESFKQEKEFTYDGEGWGLATDGQALILSDGTDQIRFLDPATFQVKRTIKVQDHGRPIPRLNELEYINGKIFANIWLTDFLVCIDPATGTILGVIDFQGLLTAEEHKAGADILNGIAYDSAGDRLFVTGKLWPKLFEVRLKPRP
jgi:glutamine cyclotransferase